VGAAVVVGPAVVGRAVVGPAVAVTDRADTVMAVLHRAMGTARPELAMAAGTASETAAEREAETADKRRKYLNWHDVRSLNQISCALRPTGETQ